MALFDTSTHQRVFNHKPEDIKKIIFAVIFISYVSCKQSTEDKLASAIKEGYKKSFEKHGDKIEDLDIKVISYDLTESSSYFLHRAKLEVDYLKSLSKIWKASIGIGSPNPHKDSLALDSQQRKMKFLDSLIDKKGYPKNVYWVKYHLRYKTEKEGFDDADSSFFSASTMHDIYVNIDTLMFAGSR